jgi:hypothetical protein
MPKINSSPARKDVRFIPYAHPLAADSSNPAGPSQPQFPSRRVPSVPPEEAAVLLETAVNANGGTKEFVKKGEGAKAGQVNNMRGGRERITAKPIEQWWKSPNNPDPNYTLRPTQGRSAYFPPGQGPGALGPSPTREPSPPPAGFPPSLPRKPRRALKR